MTTPADRAKALLARFGDVNHYSNDDYYSGQAVTGDLHVYVTALNAIMPSLGVEVYDTGGQEWEKLLGLNDVADDDLVASIIQQVIDHHDGKQVV